MFLIIRSLTFRVIYYFAAYTNYNYLQLLQMKLFQMLGFLTNIIVSRTKFL